ncbi:MAG: class I SAM-dependent methyltransferase [Anaerolineales bacterium]
MQEHQALQNTIIHAIEQRDSLALSSDAYRLFNGFYEGCPGLILDRYGSTLVIFDHTSPGELNTIIQEITHWVAKSLGDVESILLKQRQNPSINIKNGKLLSGQLLTSCITEYGVKYALDLQMNQDASFYLDTRNLRRWLLDQTQGWRLLNTFAYTGSLGVAAGMDGANLVVQTDVNKKFLDIAQRSWELNNLPLHSHRILPGDFFKITNRMRHQQQLFDCVILDPPYFSVTSAGRVDLENEMTHLINKIRPLIAHQGILVVINNALYLTGADFMEELNALCQNEYLSFEGILPVPMDITGFPNTIVAKPPSNPAPFNHPTKIALIRVFRKDKRF